MTLHRIRNIFGLFRPFWNRKHIGAFGHRHFHSDKLHIDRYKSQILKFTLILLTNMGLFNKHYCFNGSIFEYFIYLDLQVEPCLFL